MFLDRIVILILRGATIVCMTAALVILILPACYVDGIAWPKGSFLEHRKEVRDDGEGGIGSVREWDEVGYTLELRDSAGASVGLVSSHQPIAAATPVKYLWGVPKFYIFKSNLSYWPHAIFAVLGGFACLLLARITRRLIKRSSPNQSAHPMLARGQLG